MLGRCGVCGGAGEDSRRDNPSKKGIGASLAFFEYKDGSFIDITEPGRLSGRIPEGQNSPKGK